MEARQNLSVYEVEQRVAALGFTGVQMDAIIADRAAAGGQKSQRIPGRTRGLVPGSRGSRRRRIGQDFARFTKRTHGLSRARQDVSPSGAPVTALSRNNGHDTSLFPGIEHRLAEVAQASEQRVAVLRDAIADFCATELEQRDAEIAALRKTVEDLQRRLDQRSAVDRQVDEIAARLDARSAARDEAKRGPQGRQGPPGRRGEPGRPGRDGLTQVVKKVATIKNWLVDKKNFSAQPILSDGTPLPPLDLRPLFESYHEQAGYQG